MDVRMLGGGRPFVIEACNARAAPPSAEALAAATAALAAGGRVTVRELSVLTKAQRSLLREGEAEKSKAYRAVVSLSRPFTPADAAALEAAGRVTLAQATPVRVLHRRAALTRERDVLGLAARALPGHPRALVLDLRCAAGTYVKEFIHGDFGRTKPCLADLLDQAAPRATADCIQLDVVSVEMEWI
jgi:tRNA pseudouridine synthase 10